MIETTWDNVKGENFSTFTTNDKKYFKYVEKCLKESPDFYTLVYDYRETQEMGSIQIKTPKNQLKPPRPVKKKEYTEEQIAKKQEVVKMAQAARKNNKNKEQ